MIYKPFHDLNISHLGMGKVRSMPRASIFFSFSRADSTSGLSIVLSVVVMVNCCNIDFFLRDSVTSLWLLRILYHTLPRLTIRKPLARLTQVAFFHLSANHVPKHDSRASVLGRASQGKTPAAPHPLPRPLPVGEGCGAAL